MRLLTLNGGGTAGYASCLLLQRLEDEVGQPCWQMFDLIHGVSTGAIITGALGVGMSANALVELYRSDIPQIFKKLHWPFWRWYAGPAKYNAETLEQLLSEIFGETIFSQMKTACMIHAMQMSPRVQPWFWKSWRAESANEKLADMIRASSAAPTYFNPKSIGARTFVDGGMCANNPSHCTIVEALRLGVRLEDITVVNLQLGDAPYFNQHKVEKMHSIVDWAAELPDVLLSANVEIAEYISNYLVPAYINIDFNFPEALDFWSDDFARKAESMVDQYWSVHRNRVVNAVTSSRKTPLAALTETTKLPCLKNDSSDEGSNGSNSLDPRTDH